MVQLDASTVGVKNNSTNMANMANDQCVYG